jgi:hypothetical protein
MRRALLLSLLLLALAYLPAAAQRGGGARGMGGGHAIGSGHPMGSPARSAGFAPRAGGVIVHPSGNHGQFGNFSVNHVPFRNGNFHNGFRNGFRRNVIVWPWWGWGWGGWGWGWDNWDSSSYDNYQQQQAAYNQQLALQGQLQYMQQQIAEMRHDQEVQRDYAESQGATQASPPANTAPAASKPRDDGPPTTLVFRDGKRMETQNYAIVGNTLWLMADNGHMQKVPLSELDREATLKSNEDRGVEFPVPQQ